jgi:hypothetical protein
VSNTTFEEPHTAVVHRLDVHLLTYSYACMRCWVLTLWQYCPTGQFGGQTVAQFCGPRSVTCRHCTACRISVFTAHSFDLDCMYIQAFLAACTAYSCSVTDKRAETPGPVVKSSCNLLISDAVFMRSSHALAVHCDAQAACAAPLYCATAWHYNS